MVNMQFVDGCDIISVVTHALLQAQPVSTEVAYSYHNLQDSDRRAVLATVAHALHAPSDSDPALRLLLLLANDSISRQDMADVTLQQLRKYLRRQMRPLYGSTANRHTVVKILLSLSIDPATLLAINATCLEDICVCLETTDIPAFTLHLLALVSNLSTHPATAGLVCNAALELLLRQLRRSTYAHLSKPQQHRLQREAATAVANLATRVRLTQRLAGQVVDRLLAFVERTGDPESIRQGSRALGSLPLRHQQTSKLCQLIRGLVGLMTSANSEAPAFSFAVSVLAELARNWQCASALAQSPLKSLMTSLEMPAERAACVRAIFVLNRMTCALHDWQIRSMVVPQLLPQLLLVLQHEDEDVRVAAMALMVNLTGFEDTVEVFLDQGWDAALSMLRGGSSLGRAVAAQMIANIAVYDKHRWAAAIALDLIVDLLSDSPTYDSQVQTARALMHLARSREHQAAISQKALKLMVDVYKGKLRASEDEEDAARAAEVKDMMFYALKNLGYFEWPPK